jgi:hypothetical protein
MPDLGRWWASLLAAGLITISVCMILGVNYYTSSGAGVLIVVLTVIISLTAKGRGV